MNVVVKQLRIDYLRDPKSIRTMFTELAEYNDDKIFNNEAVKVLIRHFWKQMMPQMVKFVLLPFLAGFVVFNCFFAFGFRTTYDETTQKFRVDQSNPLVGYLLLISILSQGWLLFFEFLQMKQDIVSYFDASNRVQNFIDLCQVTGVTATTVILLT